MVRLDMCSLRVSLARSRASGLAGTLDRRRATDRGPFVLEHASTTCDSDRTASSNSSASQFDEGQATRGRRLNTSDGEDCARLPIVLLCWIPIERAAEHDAASVDVGTLATTADLRAETSESWH